MSSTVPYVANSWVDDTTDVTAARLTTVEQGVTDAHLMPAVRVTHNAAQSIANNTATTLAFNTERFDKAGGASAAQHDTSTNNSRLTCLYAGVYDIKAHVRWAANATGYRQVTIKVNGTTTIASVIVTAVGGSQFTDQTVSTSYELAVNDYVEVSVQQTSGGALNVNSSSNTSPEFMMVRVA